MAREKKITPEKKRLVTEMVERQGGYCSISDIRKAAGLEYGDPIATALEKEGKLLHVAQDLYKLVRTPEEAEMAKRDNRPKHKIRRGRGSY
jgi:hypothetical protein